MKFLYTHQDIKCLVSTTHGEGFGLPLFHAASNGMPVCVPAFSGHTDFLYMDVTENGKKRKKSFYTKLDYELKQVQPEAVWNGVIQPDSQWAFVKENGARNSLREVYKNYLAKKSEAKKLQQFINSTFTEENQYNAFVDAILTTPGVSLIGDSEEDTFSLLEKRIQEQEENIVEI
jgi:hypothetical protein